MQADVDQNESDADAAIAAVQADVDQNESDADAAIAAVQADVDQNESDSDAAEAANAAAIAATQADVDQNESDADAAIAAVQADVDQNESDADAADSANTAAIAAVQADVNKNETDSDNADATLQSAIDTKQDIITGGASTITSDNLSANFALLSNSNGKVAVSDVTATELSYLDGVTSAIQTQINDLLNKITTLENNIATLQQLHVPVITLTGNTSVSVNQSSGSYDDAGATANDLNDGNITSSIVTVNPVDINTSGTYTVTYNVTDSDGNAAAEVTRNVTVVDDTVPVITALGNNPESIEVGSTYTDAGATAADNNDGDITSDIVTINSVKNNIVAAYSVTYNVSDAAGNQATEVVRTVNVLDTTVPVITLTGDTSVTIEVGSTYTDAGATATDSYDGDITSSIVVVNSVNASVLGTYTVTYNVSDSSGNNADQKTRTVNVVDTTSPVITLVGSTPLNIDSGSDYNDAGATASDSFEGNLTTSIVTVNPVNTSLAGSYTITYNVTDSSGNAAAEVTRTVNVVDATPPVITGSQNANVDENETGVGTYLANESVTWSLSGADSSKFSIDNNSAGEFLTERLGAIVFSSAPNYEDPTDSDSNNIYVLTLTATDSSGNESSLNISVTVINVVEGFDSSGFSIQATTTTTTTATINWTYSGEGVEAYRLRVRIGRGGSWNSVTVFNQILPDSADLTSYTLTALTPGTLYAFRLWPIYDGGNVCKDCNGTGEPLFTTQKENN